MDTNLTLAGFSGVFVILLIFGVRWAIKRGEENAKKNAKLRGRDLPVAGGPEADLPPLKWLHGEDSPIGRKVLDCRSYALGFQFTTSDKETAATFARLCDSDGSELDGQSPDESWLIGVDWELDFEQAEMVATGMRAQTTEDLWMIDCRDNRVYLRRSWTGQLVFMLNFQRIPTDGAKITRIWVTGEEPFGQQSAEYITAYVRHLIDTHLLGILAPFPIPPDFPNDDDQKIAAFVFHSVGRRGWLAEYFSVSDDRSPGAITS